ncbi:LysM peptidoglycan-binding domain-containing protein [Blastococcus tunisiensis]|uniref:LysM domain-containing protein n=1 Tax=Blastococcus tunisiensis TaxID=1798228 RepID=A0A1I2BUT8_9ACTN|nr:LysM peptidoglycan-binding domain-containing protein [Blastococcus sp. DSM 46838]SFE59070.1 LysM domain-containing protein [Blastococcus sp. DSM 46838]
MGSVAQAVLEFDEEVRAPWRPRLVVAAEGSTSAHAPLSRPSRRSPSRVGICRPPAVPSVPARRPAAPRPEGRVPAPAGRAGSRPASGRDGVVERASAAGLRLTRRARRLAVVMALAAGVAVGAWLGPLVGDDAGGLRLAGESSIVVQPGDTLWSIASSLEGGGDVRAVIDRIQELNDLGGAELLPGQILLLP